MPTIQLIHGDALEWLPRMEAASVDMIFADPPYNLSGDGFLTAAQDSPRSAIKARGIRLRISTPSIASG